ncbi:MAG: thiamine pyrophosphate-dependent enzyme, partial [Solirubrobacteraceae bacterium]
LPTSKPLRTWLSSLVDVEQVHVGAGSKWVDPAATLSTRLTGSLEEALDALETQVPVAQDTDWLNAWTQADRTVAHAITAPLSEVGLSEVGLSEAGLSDAGLSEPAVITALAQFLPPTATLFVGASMPIRDVEEFFPVLQDPPRVLANRGANGIDGTVATALGVKAASDGEVVLLLGDVTFTHNLGALLALRRHKRKLTIVLLNNRGGGIFNFLPVSSAAEAFERHIATPPELDFSRAAELYGAEHVAVADLDGFTTALLNALAGDHTTLIEVPGDRGANRRLHAEVEAAALASLRSSSS